MADLEVVTQPLEVFRAFGNGKDGVNMYREAYDGGQTLTQWLSRQLPPPTVEDKGLDPFQRLLKAANLPTRSMPWEGIQAVTYDQFCSAEKGAGRALFPEFMSRQFRALSYPQRAHQSRAYMSTDSVVGTLENAYVDNLTPQWDTQLTAAIPLSELVARTEGISGTTYRSYFLQSDATQQSMARVAEGTEIPRFKLKGGDVFIQLMKFGAALQVTYEELRRMRIDKISYHLQRMAVQNEVNKVNKAIDVLINGDGNANTAASVVNLTTLDPDASAGDAITIKAWVAFQMLFDNPYALTTVLGPNNDVLNLLMMTAGTPTAPLYRLQNGNAFGTFTPINQSLSGAVRVGWTPEVGSLKLLGFDARYALERVYEIGSNINEVDRFITSQEEVMTMTEVEAFAVLDRNAARVIDLNA